MGDGYAKALSLSMCHFLLESGTSCTNDRHDTGHNQGQDGPSRCKPWNG